MVASEANPAVGLTVAITMLSAPAARLKSARVAKKTHTWLGVFLSPMAQYMITE